MSVDTEVTFYIESSTFTFFFGKLTQLCTDSTGASAHEQSRPCQVIAIILRPTFNIFQY